MQLRHNLSIAGNNKGGRTHDESVWLLSAGWWTRQPAQLKKKPMVTIFGQTARKD